ncbi:hypothetical protein N0V94_008699 [Neodidymelliopsis sp. IMI 364377]|nr:hypothetical protein N0V94_008699 [Neodidymelliopsis sp. IMI 364377]
MVLCIIGQIIIIPEVYLGAGRHKQFIDPKDFANGYKLNFITQPLYLFAICLVKISVGFFLLRVAVAKFYRHTIIGIMAFMGFYTIGCFFTIVLQCTNLAVQWDPTVTGTCWAPQTIKTLGYINVSLNILTDVLFSIVIPIPLLWSVQMNKRQKSSLMCILGLGIFATAAALVKTSFLPSYGKTGDWLWDSRNLTIWTVVESNIGIIAGNLPCLKPLFRAALGSTYGRGTSAKPTGAYGTRPYGPGTRHHSTTGKGWGTLASNGERDAPHAYGGKESFMLTTINAERDLQKAGSGRASEERGSEGKSSVESLTGKGSSWTTGLGRIKVDTEVEVVETRDDEDGRELGRGQRRDMV